MPMVKFQGLSIKNNAFNIKLKNKDKLSLQVIFFNSARPDTVWFSDKTNFGSFSNANFWMIREPSSAKQRAPVYDFDNAFVMASRYVNKSQKEFGEWCYETVLEQKHDFYSMSIITDPKNLFEFENGIYVNGAAQLYENSRFVFGRRWWLDPGNWANHGKGWERKTVFQFLDPAGKSLYTTSCGMRIHGNATRGFPQKSFRLIADKKYGKRSFEFDFFGTGEKQTHKSLILRNSGNDWGRTMFADYFIQSGIQGNFIDKQLFVPVDVFINGLYWGIYCLCERPDEDYLAQKYAVKKKNITIIEGEELDFGDEAVKEQYLTIISDCRNAEKNFDELYRKLEEKIDLDNFASYMAIQLYAVNTDLQSPNIKVYCIKNGKWRWMLKDLDCSYSYSGNNSFSTDMFHQLINANTTAGVIFKACMKNSQFRKLLHQKITYLLRGPLNKDLQLKRLDEFRKKFKKSIKRQISRWRKPASESIWLKYIEDFGKFIELREAEMKKQMKQHLTFG